MLSFKLDCFFFQAEDGIRDLTVTGVQTCALPISLRRFTSSTTMWLDEMRTTGDQAPRRRRWAPGLPTRAQPLAWSRVGVTVRDGLGTPSCGTPFRPPGRDKGHRRMGDARYGGGAR